MTERWGGVITSVDFAERWMADGIRVAGAGGGMVSVLVDMTSCAAALQRWKSQGRRVTYAPVIVCAVGRTLAKHSQLQKLVAGNRKLSGGRIDIGLSIAGDEILTPMVVLEGVDRKVAFDVYREIQEKAPTARAEADKLMQVLRRWGWVVPFGFLRRRILKSLLNRLWYKRGISGLLQVTILPDLDLVAAQTFNTAGILAVGGVSERPIVWNGQVTARLTACFTCTIDHKQWNGGNASIFLQELKKILEHEADSLFSNEAVPALAASAG